MAGIVKSKQRITLAITGASGAILAERLLDELLQRVERVYLVASATGIAVVKHELPPGSLLQRALGSREWREEHPALRFFPNTNFNAPIASGSASASQMVIMPCSMGTLGRIHGGMASKEIERAADVILKERRPLILCTREAPLSAVHLRNMLALSKLGAQIIPPVLCFYQKPQSLDDMVTFVVGRILDALGLEHKLYEPWNHTML